MTSTWHEYNTKCIEIKKYFNYLNSNTFESDLYKILKANLFLMLYNLIESTIRNSLEDIHNAIIRENVEYADCIDELRAIWIEFNYKKFEQTNSSDIANIISNISLDKVIVDYNDYCNKIKSNDIAGNIDGQKIRKITEKYSIEKNTRVNGHKLLTIKNTRNRLAHGEVSFSEIGQNYDISELNKIRKEAKVFLKEYLLNVNNYISEKKFKRIV